MIEVPVHNSEGEPVDTIEVDAALLGERVRPALLKQAYVRFHANRRHGAAATRSRGGITGSGKKLYRQKGTGNARRGDKKTNLLRGGGRAFAKHPKSWRQRMPDRMRRLANRNALLAKLVDHEVKLVQDFSGFQAPSTRRFRELIEKLGVDRSCLVALGDTREGAGLSARNVPHVAVVRMDQINVFTLLNHRYLVAELGPFKAWLEQIDAAGAGRQVAPEAIAAGQEASDA